MADTSDRRYETPEILSDSPLSLADDKAYFHFDEFAATLARLIAAKSTRTPLTIGISGAWGSGKTTLLRRVQRQLDQTTVLLHKDQPAAIEFVNPDESPEKLFRVCRTVWFNAWKYADEDALLVALVRVIVQTMYADDFIAKSLGAILDPFKERRDVINTVLSWFSIKTPFGDVKLNTGEPQPTVFTEKTALLDLFDDAFERLMAAWVHHKLDVDKINPQNGVLVVFIDDLDRCLPAKTVQVMEAIKLFLDKPGCVFALGADAEVVRRAVESHYQNAKVTGQSAEDYLEKVVQLRFELPPVVDAAMQDFLKEQQVNDEMLAEWRTLLAAAEVNPRRVKAVLNDIELQWRMLVNSGQAEGVQRADFIRWNAMMRAAQPSFRKRVLDIDDLDLRFKFVQDALRWGSVETDETLARTFQEYEKDGRRLRRVLRQIQSFSDEFDKHTLDAVIHLAARTLAADRADVSIERELEPASLAAGGEVKARRAVGRETVGPVIKEYARLEFVRVPAGKFLMGSKDDNPLAFDHEKPQHTVEIPQDYWIGRYPVTNAQFTAFVQATGYRTTAEEKGSGYTWTVKDWAEVKGADWQHPRGPGSDLSGKEVHPVVLVSWLDAQAYCQWLNQAYPGELPRGWVFRLPSEAEWEKAARGEYGNEWPWGNEQPDASRCNFNMNVGDTSPVGQYSPQGDSPYGAADMVGNTWEWTNTIFKGYPYNLGDGREAEKGSGTRVLRGGSFLSSHGDARCSARLEDYPSYRDGYLGFRVVASPIHL